MTWWKRVRGVNKVTVGFACLAVMAPLLLVESTTAQAATKTTFYPAGDTYVSSAAPTESHGQNSQVRVSANGTNRVGYLQFKVTGITSTSKVTLRLYSLVKESAKVEIHSVPNNAWKENTVLWANQPALSSSVIDSASSFKKKGWSDFDLSSVIKKDGVYSFGIKIADGSNGYVHFEGAEASGHHGPKIVLDPGSATVPVPVSKYTKVVNIWMENKDSSSIYTSKAPYLNELATTYGKATNFKNLTHPSEPNYIAATSGGKQGIDNDGAPSANQTSAKSIFQQLDSANKSWKSYEESMTSNCKLSSSGDYAVRHNPAAYFTAIRSSCAQNDVPMGSATSGAFATDIRTSLPNFSFVTPNLCSDMHDCSVATGEKFLKTWVPKLMDGPDYKAGRLVIIISWDESKGASEQAEIVISPTTSKVKATPSFNHYSRLAYMEDIFGLPRLGKAKDANGAVYRSSFGL